MAGRTEYYLMVRMEEHDESIISYRTDNSADYDRTYRLAGNLSRIPLTTEVILRKIESGFESDLKVYHRRNKWYRYVRAHVT